MNQLAKLTMTTMALISLGVALPGGGAFGQEKKGTTPYVTHFIFRPLLSLDVGDLGTATQLEAVGTTQNMKGEKMLDKMSARCVALNVSSGDKKYIDGACVLAELTVTRFSRRSNARSRQIAAANELRHSHHHRRHR